MAGGAIAVFGLPMLAACSRNAAPPEGLDRLFRDSDRVRQLGLSYRAAHPDEDELGLLQELTAGITDSSLASADIRGDFARGDIVTVDGWVLSRTEARLCAIYSILSS